MDTIWDNLPSSAVTSLLGVLARITLIIHQEMRTSRKCYLLIDKVTWLNVPNYHKDLRNSHLGMHELSQMHDSICVNKFWF